MDCAKGIGIVAAHGRHIYEFEGVDTLRVPSPPLILIPTTAGTSADVSQFVIISNQEERMKFSIVSKAAVPDVSLIDPETTLSMDPFLSACTGIDALVHAIEAFVSTGHGPLTDPHALEAMRLINGNLVQMIANPADIALREQIMLGSMQAGLAFSNAILGAVHAMSHSLGGYLDLPHGVCNAVLVEHVVAFNYDAAPDRYRMVAETLGIDSRGLSHRQVRERLVQHLIDLIDMPPMRGHDADALGAIHRAAAADCNDHVAALAAIQLGTEHHLFAARIGRNVGEQAVLDALSSEAGLHIGHPAGLDHPRIGNHQHLARAEIARARAHAMAAAGTKDDFRGDELALEADIRAHDCGLFYFL